MQPGTIRNVDRVNFQVQEEKVCAKENDLKLVRPELTGQIRVSIWDAVEHEKCTKL